MVVGACRRQAPTVDLPYIGGALHHTLIIGAGAAGLAAGRLLHDAGHDILIVEARDRIGGRAWTDNTFADFPIELGAEFIHGEHAATHQLVKEAGLHTIPVVRMDNLWWAENGQAALPLKNLAAPIRDIIDGLLRDYDTLPYSVPPPYAMGRGLGGGDMSLADYLRSRGWNDDALKTADVLLAQTCCARIETLSCADLIREIHADHAGSQEFRIEEGYGALFDWYSRDLPIQLNMPVSAIYWDAEGVTVIAGDQQFTAQKCILTLPIPVLQTLQFDPPLNAEKQEAIRALRTEPATKLIYRFREPLWNESLTFMAHQGLTARWWTPGYGRKDAAVIACYITADRAHSIDLMTETAALELGLLQLAQLLGLPLETMRQHLAASRRVSWADDPYALGGYAHVPPGHAEARPILAQPEGDLLFFAGEASAYDSNPQTVHGALESGWRAARECMA